MTQRSLFAGAFGILIIHFTGSTWLGILLGLIAWCGMLRRPTGKTIYVFDPEANTMTPQPRSAASEAYIRKMDDGGSER